ncbi:hypothetical protein AB1Y20_002943 [Prymnesium parvum]|uniref:Uncharacterized protein n=1 Tax=Prymnesium parvum TaxID=97485 RepID=A0AB34J9F8_PRYPA
MRTDDAGERADEMEAEEAEEAVGGEARNKNEVFANEANEEEAQEEEAHEEAAEEDLQVARAASLTTSGTAALEEAEQIAAEALEAPGTPPPAASARGCCARARRRIRGNA